MSFFGKAFLYGYHRPIGNLRKSINEGGPIVQWQTERARKEMEIAAEHMPSLPDFSPGAPMVLHIMTGSKFWYQTVFCLHSLARASQATVFAELYDDGSIDGECERRLRRLGNRVKIHKRADLVARLNDLLPESKFPTLRERWLNYPNIRKLIDTHIGKQDWKMSIDSDLLFFRRPDLLVSWFSRPAGPLHALDCGESYGYSRPLMEKIAGMPIPPLINVGLAAMRSELINWEEIEAWCTELIAKERTNYYLEQAVVAMMMARHPSRVVLPAADYVTWPTAAEVARPQAVMHHYVANSKRWYYQTGWRHIFP
jgi:hypothetical protein